MFFPGLGNGKESFNWELASDEIVEKIHIPRHIGIQSQLSADSLSFDPPGINNEIPIPKTVDEYCKWIKNLADSYLKHEIIIVGHSLGCVIARYYQKLYPDNIKKVFLMDPTPDFVLSSVKDPSWREKRSYKQIEMIINSYDSIPPVSEEFANITYVHYNIDDADPRKELFKEYIEKNFKNITNHKNKTHFIHLTASDEIVTAIKEIMND